HLAWALLWPRRRRGVPIGAHHRGERRRRLWSGHAYNAHRIPYGSTPLSLPSHADRRRMTSPEHHVHADHGDHDPHDGHGSHTDHDAHIGHHEHHGHGADDHHAHGHHDDHAGHDAHAHHS